MATDWREKRICPACKQPTRTFVPAGGDGSATVFRWHQHCGSDCRGSRLFADECPLAAASVTEGGQGDG